VDSSTAANPLATDPYRPKEDGLALLVDRARLGAGLLPTARSSALDQAAIAHANDMVAHGYMDHNAPDGSTPASRAASAGYQTPPGSPWLVVEVISARGDDPGDPMGFFMNDGVHRGVVLRPSWREMGVGYAPGGPYGRFWVIDFGCRPNILPPVLLDGTLTVPDETCGITPSTFGPVQEVRVGDSRDTLSKADWQPYSPERAWPSGRPAFVEIRDAQDRDLQEPATNPSGAATDAP
jgi:hypothetical protein